MMNDRAIAQQRHIIRAVPAHHQMSPAGRDEGEAGAQLLAALCFAHFHRTNPIQPICECRRKLRRDMLDHTDWREVARQRSQHVFQCLGPASRRPEQNQTARVFDRWGLKIESINAVMAWLRLNASVGGGFYLLRKGCALR
jgi:hypothetical protein